MIDFAGRVVLVTGAGRGLGAAYARVIAGHGATVIVHDAGVARDGSGSDPPVADAVVDEIRSAGGTAEPAYHDLSTRGACAALVEETLARHGRVDALVHSAGLVLRARLDGTDEPLWRRSLAVNVEAALWLCRCGPPDDARAHVWAHRAHDLGLRHRAGGRRRRPGRLLRREGRPVRSHERTGVRSLRGGARQRRRPVAATRIYRRKVAPGELTPAQVAPGVAFLASSACEASGVVLHAAGGRFSLGGTGIDLGGEPVTPDVIAERWAEIAL